MTGRIRWEPNGRDTGWCGFAGTMKPWAFQIWHAGTPGNPWRLDSALLGQFGFHVDHPDPEALKLHAERWLEEFTASLGAAGSGEPDCSAVTRFEAIDHTRGLASISQVSTRAVVVYGASVKLSFQDDGQTLKVFLTDPAKEAGQ